MRKNPLLGVVGYIVHKRSASSRGNMSNDIEHSVTRSEKKYLILQHLKYYPVREVAKLVDLSESDVIKLRDEALRDIQTGNAELGRAYAMLHLEKLQDCERQLMKMMDAYKELARPNEEGKLTDEAETASYLLLKSMDQLVKVMERGAKMLGLDAPVKVAGTISPGEAPAGVLRAAMEIGVGSTGDQKTPMLAAAIDPIKDL